MYGPHVEGVVEIRGHQFACTADDIVEAQHRAGARYGRKEVLEVKTCLMYFLRHGVSPKCFGMERIVPAVLSRGTSSRRRGRLSRDLSGGVLMKQRGLADETARNSVGRVGKTYKARRRKDGLGRRRRRRQRNLPFPPLCALPPPSVRLVHSWTGRLRREDRQKNRKKERGRSFW